MKCLILLSITFFVAILGCAWMSQTPYQSIQKEYKRKFGDKVILKNDEQDLFEYFFIRGSQIFTYDRMAWISSDTLNKYENYKLDTNLISEWVIIDSVVYYGKLKDKVYEINYEFDFKNPNTFYQKLSEPKILSQATSIAIAQNQTLDLFMEYIYENYTMPNFTSFYTDRGIEVYCHSGDTRTHFVLAGGVYAKWDFDLNLIEQKELHKSTVKMPWDKSTAVMTWTSGKGNILNEIDIFQSMKMQMYHLGERGIKLFQIITNKYVFVNDLSSSNLKFDIYRVRK